MNADAGGNRPDPFPGSGDDSGVEGIAIVGISVRFPGANDAATFWRNLCEGRESIKRFDPGEIEDAFSPEIRRQPNYVAARSILEDVDRFDAGFFGMLAREAELTDPQHRIFLECAWEALEDAGHDPASYDGAIGVFAGSSMNTYFLRHVAADAAVRNRFVSNYQIGDYTTLLGTIPDTLATRVAYKLGLRGPAMTLQTACSTSLVAVVQACQSLLLYQSDMALAGGVSITFPQKRGYLYQEGGMASADGHCRTFDAHADGTVFGSGAGAVLLKRLDDALADGDHIYAVIRGTALNNDGANKVSFTAPSVDGQAAAIMSAQAQAGFDPRTISYVECHGTGTPLGDPIEFAGLMKAFGADGPDHAGQGRSCALGSVKSNIGHLDVAAGVAGLVKTALSLRHGMLPPTLHFTAPNPRIDFAASPFYVNAALSPWPRGDWPRRAGVSAFGVGGTNAHVVLEEAPEPAPAAGAKPSQLIVLSARSEAALSAARTRLADHLRANPDANLADVAFTLQAGRRGFEHRLALVCQDAASAIERLEGRGGPGTSFAGRANPGEQPVVFMFPGQGAQYPGMSRELYEQEPVFREAIDQIAGLLQPELGQDLRSLLYDEHRGGDATNLLLATVLAQPAIFAVEYALARLWMSWGVQPAAMIGHSIGEFVAACLAGVMSLEDAVALVAARGRLVQEMPAGAMLAVRLPEAELMPLLQAPVALAAVNGPALCVAAGPFEAIEALEAALQSRGASFRRLHTSHAFHSPMMDPVVSALVARVSEVALHPPSIPYMSTVTGQWITDADATSAEYWGRHCRAPVRFANGLEQLVAGEKPVLLEVGPGRALTTLAMQGAGRGMTVAASLPDVQREQGDLDTIHAALGRLWVAGVRPDWKAVHAPWTRRRLSLPTYPFERSRHWIDLAPTSAVAQQPPPQPEAQPSSDPTKEQAMAETPKAAQAPARDAGAARAARMRQSIVEMLEGLSGEDLAAADPAATFLELGFDSLLLGQFAQQVQNRYGVAIKFRELLGDLPTITALTEHLLATVPAEPEPEPILAPEPVLAPAEAQFSMPSAQLPAGDGAGTVLERVMRDQLAAMQALIGQQLAALRGVAQPAPAMPAPPAQAAVVAKPLEVKAPEAKVTAAAPEAPSRFQVYRAGAAGSGAAKLTDAQQRHIDALVERYNRRTAGSKRLTQQNRAMLADPRAAAGFRAEWKEIVYPIVCARSKGSRIWDVDGNEYIDLVNGYGQTAFGHAPDFVTEAVQLQLAQGFAIGPQTALAGEVAALFCEMTGNDRVTFCNTGSEAVMAAMRVARTVTGRKAIVTFTGDYHGQFDEVLVKGVRSGAPRALPAVPGIPPGSVENMVVLAYGAPESLAWVRAHASELAAVVVEPVQSRHPELRPQAFVQELRDITEVSGTALVFDEVVTGFRVHHGGMQAVWGIRADLATYGKVAGGGMPVGMLAGKARFMDALDGGIWRYGDDSFPEVAPTFFAGTFVRHPLVMAACRAVLQHMKAEGPGLLEGATRRAGELARLVNAHLARHGLHTRAETFSSWLNISFAHDGPLAGLVWHHLRDRGIHVQDGFPWFLTTAHDDADIARVAAAFGETLDEMAEAGMFGATTEAAQQPVTVRLTEPQTEVWLAAQLGDAASCVFNESVSVTIDGPLDRDALIGAVQDVIARHDALRASFGTTGETMHIAPSLVVDVPVLDHSAEPGRLDDVIAAEAETPFDLATGPLVRARLVRLAQERHVLVFTAHHIICDGWSFNVITGEIAACYAARRKAAPASLPAALAFSAYARRQAEAGGDSNAEAYWLAQFATPIAPIELPSDRTRPAVRTFRGATYHDHIDKALYGAVKKAGARQGCTLFVTLLAGFQLLLGRLTGQQDVAVGIPSAGQGLLDDEILVGHCVHFLPLRATWSGDDTLPAFLQAVRRTVLAGYEHQNYTLGTLVRKLTLPREPGRVPLVQVQFNLERLDQSLDMPGLTVSVAPNPKRFVNFDIFMNIIESDQGLRIDVDYSTDLFDESTIARWIGAYRTLLGAMAAQSDAPVARLPIMPEAERHLLLVQSNDTAAAYDASAGIHDLFAEQAARSPEAVAVVCAGETLTYAELDARANGLARHLLRRVVEPDARIGIMMERSTSMLTALLAVMKAGFAYVPLDPGHPGARLRLILENAGVAAVVTDGGGVAGAVPSGVPVIDILRDASTIAPAANPPLPAHRADRAAYVIYTSGSTGQPKGVEVMHRSVVNLLVSTARAPGFAAQDRLLAVTTIAFDIAVLELFLPLTVGGRVVIATNAETMDGAALVDLIRSSGATVMQATPSLWRGLLAAEFRSWPGLRMLCGGEALSRELADRLLEGGGELWNMYGPTETTIWSAAERVAADGPITVGHPIANTRFYVVDANDQPLPAGVPGELLIAGDGLARGYVGAPGLTQAAFRMVPIDGGPPERTYRTGDAARWLPDGRVQILGRLDGQVKLRGFRIETGEIEAALSRVPGVAEAAVVLKTDGDGTGRLVGYHVPVPGQVVSAARMRQALADHLPDYMIPAGWVELGAMPMTANGKLDRRALPDPQPGADAGPRVEEAVGPRNALEESLVAIWAEVLKRGTVGVHDNLFALGADSLHLFQIAARMTRAGIGLSARHLFQHPTIAELAAVATSAPAPVPSASAVPSLRQFRRDAAPVGMVRDDVAD